MRRVEHFQFWLNDKYLENVRKKVVSELRTGEFSVLFTACALHVLSLDDVRRSMFFEQILRRTYIMITNEIVINIHQCLPERDDDTSENREHHSMQRSGEEKL